MSDIIEMDVVGLMPESDSHNFPWCSRSPVGPYVAVYLIFSILESNLVRSRIVAFTYLVACDVNVTISCGTHP